MVQPFLCHAECLQARMHQALQPSPGLPSTQFLTICAAIRQASGFVVDLKTALPAPWTWTLCLISDPEESSTL